MKKTEIVEQIDYSSLSYDELSEISRNDHQEDTHQYDKQQNALCLVMIGLICLVCAILFFFLSYRKKYGIIDMVSLQFYVCAGCALAAAVLLTIGLIRFFRAFAKRRHLKEEIATVTLLRKNIMVEKN